MKIKNAKIKKADIKIEDGALVLNIEMEGDGWGIIYPLHLCNRDENIHTIDDIAGRCIVETMQVVGVTRFSELNGSNVRAIFEGNGNLGSRMIGMQNIIKDNIYFIKPGYELSEEDRRELIGDHALIEDLRKKGVKI